MVEKEKEGGTGLSSRGHKTLVYSNDRGLLFGRIPSLIRFTSSAPSFSSFKSYSSGRFSSSSSSSTSCSSSSRPFLRQPRVQLLRDAIFHLAGDYSCLSPPTYYLYDVTSILLFVYFVTIIPPSRLISHYCAIDKIADVSWRRCPC